MNSVTFWGIWCMGFVFGYLLYYAVRHTKEFNIELLSSAFAAVGGGVVVSFFGQTPGLIGPYGIGIGSGFSFYLILSLLLIGGGTLAGKRLLLSQTLLGRPRKE